MAVSRSSFCHWASNSFPEIFDARGGDARDLFEAVFEIALGSGKGVAGLQLECGEEFLRREFAQAVEIDPADFRRLRGRGHGERENRKTTDHDYVDAACADSASAACLLLREGADHGQDDGFALVCLNHEIEPEQEEDEP
jgi:hypothetical protein